MFLFVLNDEIMLVIGIESSAHTFGVGIVKDGKVLSNAKSMYKITNKGMIPIEVAEHHIENAASTIKKAVLEAGISFKELDGVGYTMGPGLGPCLQVGQLSAKALAYKLNIPLLPINHGLAHIEITKHMERLKDPLVLYVSGGNSQLLVFNKEERRYIILGETFDMGVGNAIDNLARKLGLEHAWGSEVEKLAKDGKYIKMPYTVKGMDFAFTGLLTNAIGMLKKYSVKDILFSFQETAFAQLCEATERALLLTKKSELCVCGGVAQNNRLAEMLTSIAEEHNIRFARTKNEFNSDNGAMIAIVAEKEFLKGKRCSIKRCDIKQRYRVDEAVFYG